MICAVMIQKLKKLVKKLADSMPERVKLILKAKGYIKYSIVSSVSFL
jgi:hypothetical protein